MSSIVVFNKPYKDDNALEDVILYALETAKNNLDLSNVYWECFGVNSLSFQNIVESFRMVKRKYNKLGGKQIHHFVLSLYRKNFYGIENKEQWCSLLLYDVGNHIRNLGYMNIVSMHTDLDGNVHLHFVMNSVNGITGRKIDSEQYFYNNLLHYLRMNYSILNWEGIVYKKVDNK